MSSDALQPVNYLSPSLIRLQIVDISFPVIRRHNILYSLLILLALGACLILTGRSRFSVRLEHSLKLSAHHVRMRLASRGRGEAVIVSITGETGIPGAEVQALDSVSGWATLCDNQGRFTLPGLAWYPRASYTLLVSTDYNTVKVAEVVSPSAAPPDDIINAGPLDFSTDWKNLSDMPGVNATSLRSYDFSNRDYYRGLYARLTEGEIGPDAKIDAVNHFVAQKLNYDQTFHGPVSPRNVIENGTEYCGPLAETFAAILSPAFPVRIIDLMDRTLRFTHVVAEVRYQGEWHLYDPTFGTKFIGPHGRVASYRDLRLNPKAIAANSFAEYRRRYPELPLDWMTGVYESGYHHYYAFSYRCSQYAHAWFCYQSGLNYLPVGGKVLLAAAGVRSGSRVTFHIRRPGTADDLLQFTTTNKANSVSVLNQEESPAINLAPGTYDVFVDLHDGNITRNSNVPELLSSWLLGVPLEVR